MCLSWEQGILLTESQYSFQFQGLWQATYHLSSSFVPWSKNVFDCVFPSLPGLAQDHTPHSVVVHLGQVLTPLFFMPSPLLKHLDPLLIFQVSSDISRVALLVMKEARLETGHWKHRTDIFQIKLLIWMTKSRHHLPPLNLIKFSSTAQLLGNVKCLWNIRQAVTHW